MIAFVFPGQGSQVVGMGKALADAFPVCRQTFDEADAALGLPLSATIFHGPAERLTLTEITQPAILTASVAAWRLLESRGWRPTIVAGHSLGEYSAHVAAGTFTFADAVRTVHHRGRYMQEAVPVGSGAMAAVLGADEALVAQACAEASEGEVVSPANLNAPGINGDVNDSKDPKNRRREGDDGQHRHKNLLGNLRSFTFFQVSLGQAHPKISPPGITQIQFFLHICRPHTRDERSIDVDQNRIIGWGERQSQFRFETAKSVQANEGGTAIPRLRPTLTDVLETRQTAGNGDNAERHLMIPSGTGHADTVAQSHR